MNSDHQDLNYLNEFVTEGISTRDIPNRRWEECAAKFCLVSCYLNVSNCIQTNLLEVCKKKNKPN